MLAAVGVVLENERQTDLVTNVEDCSRVEQKHADYGPVLYALSVVDCLSACLHVGLNKGNFPVPVIVPSALFSTVKCRRVVQIFHRLCYHLPWAHVCLDRYRYDAYSMTVSCVQYIP